MTGTNLLNNSEQRRKSADINIDPKFDDSLLRNPDTFLQHIEKILEDEFLGNNIANVRQLKDCSKVL